MALLYILLLFALCKFASPDADEVKENSVFRYNLLGDAKTRG